VKRRFLIAGAAEVLETVRRCSITLPEGSALKPRRYRGEGGAGDRMARFRRGTPMLAVVIALMGCQKEKAAEAPAPRPVRTVTVAPQETAEAVVLTGHIAAENEASLGFRIGGRLIERPVNVGDHVDAAQVVAKLDPQDEVNALRSAQAALASARARLTEARDAFERQRLLLANGHTPRAQFDRAQQELRTAQANVDDAEARQQNQALRVSWTVLQADAPGTVSARGAEPGEVVQPGQMVVRIARKEGRDAVFDVPGALLREAPANPVITVRLSDDASVTSEGRVREVAAQADPATRTFEVKVGLTDAPEAMRLGSTVTGTLHLDPESAISIPASALTDLNNQPAVWVVDPVKLTVSLRNIETLRFDPATVVVAHGLDTGEIVVTAGVHALHPGQTVRLLGHAS